MTPEQEKYLIALADKGLAEQALEKKLEEYTAFRGALDDADDPLIIEKSQVWEDEIAVLKTDLETKEAEVKNPVVKAK